MPLLLLSDWRRAKFLVVVKHTNARVVGSGLEKVNSVKVRLRVKSGRGWRYREIEIPTDVEMERISADLHAKHQPALKECLGWKVFYNPARQLGYSTTEVNPFTGEKGEIVRNQSQTISYCVFGYGAEWQVCYSWACGENKSPTRIQEKGDVVPIADGSQGNLFDAHTASSGISDNEASFEGAVRRSELSTYERSWEARRLCIEHYGAKCFICGFDFGSVYGQSASGFIHVHHLKPLAEIGAEYIVDPIRDLRPVCPNCHAVLHMKSPPFDIEEVQRLVGNSTGLS